MRFHLPGVGLHSLRRLSGRLHLLRMLLLVPLTILMLLHRAVSALLLALMLVLDLAANLLTRGFDQADDAAVALDSIVDFLMQATLLMALVPRFPGLGIAVLPLLLRLALVLLPDWREMHGSGCARLCALPEKLLSMLCCALLLVPLLQPALSAGATRALGVALCAMNAGIILLRKRKSRVA